MTSNSACSGPPDCSVARAVDRGQERVQLVGVEAHDHRPLAPSVGGSSANICSASKLTTTVRSRARWPGPARAAARPPGARLLVDAGPPGARAGGAQHRRGGEVAGSPLRPSVCSWTAITPGTRWMISTIRLAATPWPRSRWSNANAAQTSCQTCASTCVGVVGWLVDRDGRREPEQHRHVGDDLQRNVRARRRARIASINAARIGSSPSEGRAVCAGDRQEHAADVAKPRPRGQRLGDAGEGEREVLVVLQRNHAADRQRRQRGAGAGLLGGGGIGGARAGARIGHRGESLRPVQRLRELPGADHAGAADALAVGGSDVRRFRSAGRAPCTPSPNCTTGLPGAFAAVTNARSAGPEVEQVGRLVSTAGC